MRKVLIIAMTLIFVWSCSKDQEELIPSNSNDFFAYSSIDNPVLDNVVSFLQKRNEIENFTSDFSIMYGDVIWDENITIKNEKGFVMLIPTLLNQEVEGIWLFDCFKGTINYAVIVNDQEVRQDKNMDYNFAYFEQTLLNKNDKYKFIEPNEKDYNIRTKEGAHIIEHCNMIFTGNNTIGFELTDIHCWNEYVPGTVSGRYIYDYYTDQVGGGQGDLSDGGGGVSPGSDPAPVPAPEKPIESIEEYLDCIDPNLSATLTIYVDQPKPNENVPNSGVDVGHTFIGISQAGNNSVFGFYPDGMAKPTNKTHGAALGEDDEHIYDVSITKDISHQELSEILVYVNNYKDRNYNLDNFNCTDFAIQVAKRGNLNLPDTYNSWIGGGGSNPGSLGQDIRNMILPSGVTRNTDGGTSPQNVKTCNN